MNKFLIFFIIIIIFFILTEMDRNFNTYKGSYIYSIKFYYYNNFPLPIIGLLNTINRLTYPNKHYFNSSIFSNDHIFKNNYKLIQSEALKLYQNKEKLVSLADLNNDKKKDQWKIYLLQTYNNINETARIECPNTCKLLEQCNDIYIALFSILEPGKCIYPHKGPSAQCLRYHLALTVPQNKNDCYIIINGQKFVWSEGESLVIDDTYMHSVYNNTNEPRIILFLDIINPNNFLPFEINRYLMSKSFYAHFI